MLDNLEAMVFDLDDTLIVEEATARASLRHAAALVDPSKPDAVAEVLLEAAREVWYSGPFHDRCLELGFASWEGLWATFEGCHWSLDGLRDWIPTYRAAAWSNGLEALGVAERDLVSALASNYRACQLDGHPLIAGADELVRSLGTRYRLGLLTNGPADIQRRKLAETGLVGCFEVVGISGETAIGKPAPRAFAGVLERLKVDPVAAVMIGDSWERDVLGARSAGMSAIWLAGDRAIPSPMPGVHVVRDLQEVSAFFPSVA